EPAGSTSLQDAAVQPPLWEELVASTRAGANEEDDLLPEARQIVKQQGRASISLLQRRLRIGYARAARLIDLLEEEGTIGAADGPGRARQVYVEDSGPGEENDPGWDPSWVTED
ncbi:MAG TPA: hypothetical protein DEP84_29745, partial [Chloroflexi bacterium]|nr:hypothetical protein [Chloroflexota bacterium]